MDFERKLKSKAIIAVMSVLCILCVIYFSVGIKNQKQYIDWQIQKETEILNVELKNLLQTTDQLYRDKIQYFVNNPNLKEEFKSANIESLLSKSLSVVFHFKIGRSFSFCN